MNIKQQQFDINAKSFYNVMRFVFTCMHTVRFIGYVWFTGELDNVIKKSSTTIPHCNSHSVII